MRGVRPLLPVLLLTAFTVRLGTFPGAAEGGHAALGHALLLVVLAMSGREAVARRGWLSASLVWIAAIGLSWWLSPVMRAGATVVTMLPAWLAVPLFVARCWRDDAARRVGTVALSAVVGGVAGWSLIAQWSLDASVAAEPLGHHNLLATWLVVLLPLTVVPCRGGGPAAVVGFVAAWLGVVALVASGSLGGLLALAVIIAGALWARRATLQVSSSRRLAIGAGIGVLVAVAVWRQLPRLQAILAGTDESSLARWGYWQAGWAGWFERPLVGWGPGASRWTVSEWLRPIPGVHPADQVVADLHGAAIQLLFELGLLGVVAIVAGAVLAVGRRSVSVDPVMALAARLGLVGLATTALVSGFDWSTTALPMALAVAVGALLAATESSTESAALPASRQRVALIVAVCAALCLAVVQWPRDAAHLAYDRALDALDLEALNRAVELDPAFPAYRWRLAMVTADAEAAVRAASDARGLAPLWVSAGVLATPHDTEALVRACDLSPLGALPAFRLAIEGEPELSAERATRALAASPILLAAVDWPRREGVLDAGVTRVDRWRIAGDEVWRRAFVDAADWLDQVPVESREDHGRIGLVVDAEPATSLSFHAFRRRPHRAVVDMIEVDLGRVEVLQSVLGSGFAIGPGLTPSQVAPSCRLALPPWAVVDSP